MFVMQIAINVTRCHTFSANTHEGERAKKVPKHWGNIKPNKLNTLLLCLEIFMGQTLLDFSIHVG